MADIDESGYVKVPSRYRKSKRQIQNEERIKTEEEHGEAGDLAVVQKGGARPHVDDYIHPEDEPPATEKEKQYKVSLVQQRNIDFWKDLSKLELDQERSFPIHIQFEHIRYMSSYEHAIKAHALLMKALDHRVSTVLDGFGGTGVETQAFLWSVDSPTPVTVHVVQENDPPGLFRNENTTFQYMKENINNFRMAFPEVCVNKDVVFHNMSCRHLLTQTTHPSGAWDALILDCPWEKKDENGQIRLVSGSKRQAATDAYKRALLRGDPPGEAEEQWLHALNELDPHGLMKFINEEVFKPLDEAGMTFKCMLIKCRFGSALMRGLLNTENPKYDLVTSLKVVPFRTPYYYHILKKNNVQEMIMDKSSDLHGKNLQPRIYSNKKSASSYEHMPKHAPALAPGYAGNAAPKNRVLFDGDTDFKSYITKFAPKDTEVYTAAT